MTALIEMEGRPKTASEPTEHPVEQHVRISGEVDLHNWNAKLADSELCNQYVSSFYKNVFLCEPVCSITCHRYCFINLRLTFPSHLSWRDVPNGAKHTTSTASVIN